MVKVIGPSLALDAKGTLADTLTFQKRPSGHALYLRNHPGGREPYTPPPKVLAQRTIIANLVYAWRHLDVNYREQWDELAKEMGEAGTGYHLYIKYNGVFPTIIDCLDFDGTDDYVKTSVDPIPAAQYTNGLTFECWAKFDTFDAEQQQILDHYGRIYLSIKASVNKLKWSISTSTGEVLSDLALQIGIWYHLAGTWLGTTNKTVTAYINGVAQASTKSCSTVPSIDEGTRPIALGIQASSPYATNPMDGKIVEVRIWNKALNVADLLIHTRKLRDITSANTPLCSYASNCLIHYPMNVENGVGTILTDVRSGKTGTFKGAGEPAWKQNALFKDIYGLT